MLYKHVTKTQTNREYPDNDIAVINDVTKDLAPKYKFWPCVHLIIASDIYMRIFVALCG